jgi:hypothetical protein
MATKIENILDSIEQLSDPEKRELLSEIMRRTVSIDVPPLTDEELVLIAEESFLELDKRESRDGWLPQRRGVDSRSWARGESQTLPYSQRPSPRSGSSVSDADSSYNEFSGFEV